jgi:hypothetical protein
LRPDPRFSAKQPQKTPFFSVNTRAEFRCNRVGHCGGVTCAGFHSSRFSMEKSEIRPFTPPEAVEINKGSNLPCSFAGPLRCSLVADRGGYAPRSRLARPATTRCHWQSKRRILSHTRPVEALQSGVDKPSLHCQSLRPWIHPTEPDWQGISRGSKFLEH